MTDIEREIRNHESFQVVPNGVALVSNTFYMDFEIAEKISGISGIKDTYERSFESFKDSIEYLTAMVIALNHHGFDCYEREQHDLAKVYFDLQGKLDAYILKGKSSGASWKPINFTMDEVRYYYQATD